MSGDVYRILRLYDGELLPYKETRDPRRMFVDEMSMVEQNILKEFLQNNIIMIILDIVRSRGKYTPEWVLVINSYENQYKWSLISINEASSKYIGDGKVVFTKNENIHLGNILLQRKGGDCGKETANMLQFKTNPLILLY